MDAPEWLLLAVRDQWVSDQIITVRYGKGKTRLARLGDL